MLQSTFLCFMFRSVCSLVGFSFLFSTYRIFFSSSVSGASFNFSYMYSCMASVIATIAQNYLRFLLSKIFDARISATVTFLNSQLFSTSSIFFQTSAADFPLSFLRSSKSSPLYCTISFGV